MDEKEPNSILDYTWLAIVKGDKAVAEGHLKKLGYRLFIGDELDRSDRLRLGWALMDYGGDPVKFFGFSRRGPSPTKTLEQLEIWAAVKSRKDQLKKNGGKQTDAFADVAEMRNCSETKVKSDYEKVQTYLQDQEKESAVLTKGIASLIK